MAKKPLSVTVTVMSRRAGGEWGTRNRLTQENADYLAGRITLGQLMEIAARIKMAWELSDQFGNEFAVKALTRDGADYNEPKRRRQRATAHA